MPETVPRSHIVAATRHEQIRLRPATRDGLPVVRLDVLEPLTKHSSALVVVGRPVLIPVGQVAAVCEALARAAEYRPEAAPPRPAPPPRRRIPTPEPEGEF